MPKGPSIAKILHAKRKELGVIDNDTIMSVVGVAQALDEMRKALDEVDACLDSREFEKAAQLGYDSVSSGFVFLQRTLAGLQHDASAKDQLVSEIAGKVRLPFEDVQPHVDAAMECTKPPKRVTRKQRAEIKRREASIGREPVNKQRRRRRSS